MEYWADGLKAVQAFIPRDSGDFAAWVQALATASALWLTVQQSMRQERAAALDKIDRMRGTASSLRSARYSIDKITSIELGPNGSPEIQDTEGPWVYDYVDSFYLSFIEVPVYLVASADANCLSARTRFSLESVRAEIMRWQGQWRSEATINSKNNPKTTRRDASRKLHKISEQLKEVENMIAKDVMRSKHHKPHMLNPL